MMLVDARRRRRALEARLEPYEREKYARIRRSKRLVALGAVMALAVVAAIAYAAVLAFSGPTRRAQAAHPATATSPSSGGLVLDKPRYIKDGVGLGWPDNPRGAVSAAVNYAEDLSGNQNLGRLDAVLALTVVPAHITKSVTWLEKQASPVASSMRGESVLTKVMDYRLAACNAQRCSMWLLGTIVITQANGSVITHTLDGGAVLVWSGNDWKLVDVTSQPAGPKPPSASPGTSAAVQKGWTPLVH